MGRDGIYTKTERDSASERERGRESFLPMLAGEEGQCFTYQLYCSTGGSVHCNATCTLRDTGRNHPHEWNDAEIGGVSVYWENLKFTRQAGKLNWAESFWVPKHQWRWRYCEINRLCEKKPKNVLVCEVRNQWSCRGKTKLFNWLSQGIQRLWKL